MLEISIEEYNVAIYPLPPSNGAYYQSSNEMMAIVNGTLFLEEAGPFNLTFSCMEMIADFIIGEWMQLNLSSMEYYIDFRLMYTTACIATVTIYNYKELWCFIVINIFYSCLWS